MSASIRQNHESTKQRDGTSDVGMAKCGIDAKVSPSSNGISSGLAPF